MPRLSHALPKYRKHRGSGQAIVNLNGQDFYLGPHGTKASKIEYDRLIGEWLANGRQPLHATSQDILIVELCLRYWKFAKGHYQKNGRCTRVASSAPATSTRATKSGYTSRSRIRPSTTIGLE